ncbi:MAG: hypothetical protein JNJ46_02985 [Myxococcales bacterium]|nr:hypothetical protein [Myxococcales bacterium]
MILDLRLPAGWTQAPIGRAAPEPADEPTRRGFAALAVGTIYWPPDEEAGRHERPAALLLSPALPLLRSPTQLLRAALASEPDYAVEHESPYISARLGPWEATLLETQGRSHETGLVSARIYAVLDAGHAAFMLVFVDCDPERMDLRREQLAEILAQARLRRSLGPQPAANTTDPEAPALPEQDAESEAYALDAGLHLEDAATTVEAGAPLDPTPEEPAAEPAAAGTQEPASHTDPAELPTPPQRPAEDVYLGGVLFPYLID